jgi:biotin carboxylase
MTDKHVLFICGGKWQVPWAKYLITKGHSLIVVDPYKHSPVVRIADIHLQCDARDAEKIYELIKQNKYEIDFVTSDQTDVATTTVSELSKKLNLIGNSLEVVKVFSNKYENRVFLMNNFSKCYPNFIKAHNYDEVANFLSKVKTEIIIKPVDAQSSRGIYKIGANSKNLEKIFKESLSYSKENYIIAEQFVNGKEITIEGFCVNNKHITLAISDKKHFRTGIASELKYPSIIDEYLQKNLVAFHNSFVESTGLKFGITHSEYIVNEKDNDFWLVESACRGGGSLISSHIVPWVTGVNLYECYYDALFGKNVTIKPYEISKSAILYFFEFPSGVVTSIEGLEIAKEIEGVFELELEFKVGDLIRNAADDRGRQGYVIIFAETDTELQHILNQVVNIISVQVK